MGQANIRGTFEERKRLSIKKYGRKEERKSAIIQNRKVVRSRLRKRRELQDRLVDMLEGVTCPT